MTLDEREALVRVKIGRASRHITELKSEVESFLGTRPYEVATKRNSQTHQLIYYLASVADVPSNISATAGDALQCLRTALDYLAYQLVLVGTGTSGPFDHVYFPIADSAAIYDATKGARTKGMRAAAVGAIDATHPYKGGNDVLWHIHKLNNVDKHRLLITVGSAFRSVDLGGYMLRAMRRELADRPELADLAHVELPAFFRPADRMFPLAAGAELFIDGPDAEADPEMEFRFEVAFGEPGIVEGEPLQETLTTMAETVENLVTTFRPLLA